MSKVVVFMVGLALAGVSWGDANGSADPAPIVSVGLYKNGNAVLTRRVTPEKGVSLVEMPACLPAYGTFWHTSKTPVNVTTVREPKRVTVTFRADTQMGTLLAQAEKSPDMVLTVIDPVSRGSEKGVSDAFFTISGACLENQNQGDEVNRFAPRGYRIRLASGSVVKLNASQVVASTGLDDMETGAERNACFWKFEGGEAPFQLRYLTGGATWAPSYLLTFNKDGKSDLFMNAEIRNEIADWQDVDVSLISGFPSIKYAGVDALIGDADIAAFAREVDVAENGEPNFGWRRMGAKRKDGMMTQAMCLGDAGFASMNGYQAANGSAGAGSAGAGSDIHYRPIGKISLKKSATVSLPLGAKTTDYKRIVDWSIADRRDYWGRLQRNDEDDEQELWDSVKFKNPFEFPMTTGAIEITEEGRIVGQAQCTWTNPGDETLVKITKALSVKGRCSEESDGRGVRGKVASLGADERFRFDGNDYRRETITAKIRVQNFRKEPATLNVKKTFSGEMVESDFKPTKTRNLPARDGRVNVERELTWEFDLQPGEKKEIKVVYWLWVRM